MNLDTTGYEIEEDGLRVEVTWIGEGYAGEYDPEDLQDVPLARFYVMKKDADGFWQDVGDGSYCTLLPADNYGGMVKLARIILGRAGDAVRNDSNYKHILEELSWFNGNESRCE